LFSQSDALNDVRFVISGALVARAVDDFPTASRVMGSSGSRSVTLAFEVNFG